MITKYLIEGMTGLYVGDAAVSPSLAKMKALSESQIGQQKKEGEGEKGVEQDGGGVVKGQGEVVAVRTRFPHASGKLVSEVLYCCWIS